MKSLFLTTALQTNEDPEKKEMKIISEGRETRVKSEGGKRTESPKRDAKCVVRGNYMVRKYSKLV